MVPVVSIVLTPFQSSVPGYVFCCTPCICFKRLLLNIFQCNLFWEGYFIMWTATGSVSNFEHISVEFFCFFFVSLGLRLALDIGQYEYIPKIGEAAGVVVVVHPGNQMPFPEDEGMLVLPGKGTGIAVKAVSVIILVVVNILTDVFFPQWLYCASWKETLQSKGDWLCIASSCTFWTFQW